MSATDYDPFGTDVLADPAVAHAAPRELTGTPLRRRAAAMGRADPEDYPAGLSELWDHLAGQVAERRGGGLDHKPNPA